MKSGSFYKWKPKLYHWKVKTKCHFLGNFIIFHKIIHTGCFFFSKIIALENMESPRNDCSILLLGELLCLPSFLNSSFYFDLISSNKHLCTWRHIFHLFLWGFGCPCCVFHMPRKAWGQHVLKHSFPSARVHVTHLERLLKQIPQGFWFSGYSTGPANLRFNRFPGDAVTVHPGPLV